MEELEGLFRSLDLDGNGWLSLAELRSDLEGRSLALEGQSLADLLEAMDLDANGRVDAVEFSELLLRLRRLMAGQQRLLQYLVPIDADGDERLDSAEIDRLLRSVGQEKLQAAEKQALFHRGAGRDQNNQGSLSWKQFLDRLLLS